MSQEQEKEKVSIRMDLKGQDLLRFHKLKKRLGLRFASEVVRAAISLALESEQ